MCLGCSSRCGTPQWAPPSGCNFDGLADAGLLSTVLATEITHAWEMASNGKATQSGIVNDFTVSGVPQEG